MGHGPGHTSSPNPAHGDPKLPTNVSPRHYDLTLDPNLEAATYYGRVAIDIFVLQDSSSITLNTLNVKIHETRIDAGTVKVQAARLVYNHDAQTTRIELSQVVGRGRTIRLTIHFTGTLNDVMAGFYRSSYKNEHGIDRYLATTQMEATDARRAFPCFDEPGLKATFTVTLVADYDMTCLSNMDVASERDIGYNTIGRRRSRRKAVTFNRTPLMSTYLLAFIVGKLKVYETNSFRVPVRVYSTPDKDVTHGRYAAELAARALEFYEIQFGIPYALPKMDMVAIPDFSTGAMENWGLITYHIEDLLVDEKAASADHKYMVAETVLHELAHQWFGNLVTMSFWDGLWLNEGFATWMSWYACNALHPKWKVWDGYVTNELRSALALDSLRSSHPIDQPVNHAHEINQIFDSISYSKGSCVLRMVARHLGESVFMNGIRRYLKKHAYDNTDTNDLWAALAEVSGIDVGREASIWTKNVGHPVVSVIEDDKTSSIHVRQNRFLRTGDVKPEEDEVLYPIFLGLRTKTGVQEDINLYEREGTFTLPSLDFFKLNADHSGFYRTLYTTERLLKLGENAKAGLLTISDRAGVISDAGALCQAGYQRTSGLLSLLKGFDSESEYQVWDEINLQLNALQSAWTFEDDKVNEAIRAFKCHLLSGKTHELGWQFTRRDSHILQQFKALMFENAANAGDHAVKAAAFDMFNRFNRGDRQAIHPNLRESVFATVLRYGGVAEYEGVMKEAETATKTDQRNEALRALGASRHPELIQRTLDFALSKDVKSQDVWMPIRALRSHRAGIEALWAWLQTNWGLLNERLPPSLGNLGIMVRLGTSNFTRDDQRAEVERWFAARSTKGFDMDLAQGLDAIRTKELWTRRDRTDVEVWLKENGYL